MDINEYADLIKEHEVDGSWRNYLDERYEDYRKKYELVLKRQYNGSFPVCIEVEASYHCNLKCLHCYRSLNIGGRAKKNMSPELWNTILKEIKKNKLPSIMMDHEGESLMNPNFLNMLRDVKAAGVLDIWLHTNANMLNPKLSEDLIQGGLTKINFSIDAATEETYNNIRRGGNFTKVVDNVKDFMKIKLKRKAYYLRTRVSFVLQQSNRHEYDQFYEYWKNIAGLNVIAFQQYMDFSIATGQDNDLHLNENQLENKYKDYPPFYCSKPWEMPIIDVDGNVVPCGSPVRVDQNNFVLGNLLNGDTIEKCWNSQRMASLKELHMEGKWYLNSTCRACVKCIKHISAS